MRRNMHAANVQSGPVCANGPSVNCEPAVCCCVAPNVCKDGLVRWRDRAPRRVVTRPYAHARNTTQAYVPSQVHSPCGAHVIDPGYDWHVMAPHCCCACVALCVGMPTALRPAVSRPCALLARLPPMPGGAMSPRAPTTAISAAANSRRALRPLTRIRVCAAVNQKRHPPRALRCAPVVAARRSVAVAIRH